jgi:hypothetical protein
MRLFPVCVLLLSIFAVLPSQGQTGLPTPASTTSGPVNLVDMFELLGQMIDSSRDVLRRVTLRTELATPIPQSFVDVRIRMLNRLRQQEADFSLTPQDRSILSADIASSEMSIEQLEFQMSFDKERTGQVKSVQSDAASASAALSRIRKSLGIDTRQIDSGNLTVDFCTLSKVTLQLRRSQLLLDQSVLASTTSAWVTKASEEQHAMAVLTNIVEDPTRRASPDTKLSLEIHTRKVKIFQTKLDFAKKQQKELAAQQAQLDQEEKEGTSCPAVKIEELSADADRLLPVLQEMALDWRTTTCRTAQDEISSTDSTIRLLGNLQYVVDRDVADWQTSPGSAPMPTDSLNPSIKTRISQLQQQRESLMKSWGPMIARNCSEQSAPGSASAR